MVAHRWSTGTCRCRKQSNNRVAEVLYQKAGTGSESRSGSISSAEVPTKQEGDEVRTQAKVSKRRSG